MERIRPTRLRVLAAAIVASLALIGACSASSSDDAATSDSTDESSSDDSGGGEALETASGAFDGDAASGDGGGSTAGGAGGNAMVDAGTVTDIDVELAGAEFDRKIVYRGDIASEVDDVASAVRSARDEVAAEGGFVFGQEISGETARVVLKVPSVRFDAAFDAVASIGEVTQQSIEADDVTEQFTDLDSRRATLEASIIRLRGFLDAATNADEVSRLESELTRREAERDVIAGQLRVLEDRTTFGTISAVFTTPAEEVAVAEEDDESGLPGFSRGLEVGVDGVVVLAGAVATTAGFLLPYVPLVLAGMALVWWLRRRRAEVSAPADRPSPA